MTFLSHACAGRPTCEEALADPYFDGLSQLGREPSAQPVSKLAFDFERRKLNTVEVRLLPALILSWCQRWFIAGRWLAHCSVLASCSRAAGQTGCAPACLVGLGQMQWMQCLEADLQGTACAATAARGDCTAGPGQSLLTACL